MAAGGQPLSGLALHEHLESAARPDAHGSCALSECRSWCVQPRTRLWLNCVADEFALRIAHADQE